MLAIILPPNVIRVAVTVASVLVALVVTGASSAISSAPPLPDPRSMKPQGQSSERFPLSTFQGLPAHILLVHFIVVLAPLTAVLAILCALWPPARRHLTWLVLILAAGTTILTPLTTDAGEWLEHRTRPTELLNTHTELGDTMLYFSIGLLVAAVLLAVVHVREHREKPLKPVITWAIAAVVVIASIATTVQVYRIGDSGARSTWGDKVAESAPK